MKAVAVVPGKRQVQLIEQEPPRLGSPTQVGLRMLEVGVCGTDREICAFQYGTPPAGSEHLVIGHESLGQVVEVGPVVTMVRRPCAHAECVACRAGRQDFCFTADFSERGIKNLHGFMTETVVDEERYMHLVPAALREVAVLVEPLTIAEKALIQVDQVQQRLPWACEIEPGKPRTACHRAVVLGAGPVGLLGAMALAAAGYDTSVYSRERAPNPKADLVAAIGGHYYSAEET
ncbi:MAG: glucose dehydrogenase, partial [Deltaproteobacteria bacterium]